MVLRMNKRSWNELDLSSIKNNLEFFNRNMKLLISQLVMQMVIRDYHLTKDGF